MFGFFRKTYGNWIYCAELNKILDEEEKLVKEWTQKFSKSTSRNIAITTGPFDRTLIKNTEAIELKQIWEELSQLHRESRKLEEITNLTDMDEEQLLVGQRKSLRQLRNKLRWKPIKLKKSIWHYLKKIK